jgi:heme exporter protein CcmB
MQTFWIIFKHELQISFHHLGRILANFLFFLISVAIFFLLAQNLENQGSILFYKITIIWFSLLSCLIFSSAEFLKKDFDDGTIEQILNSCDNFEVFTLAKMLSNWLVSCLPIFASIPFILANSNLGIGNFLIIFFLSSLAINFICSFCGSLSILGNSAPIIAMIALPLIIPVLLISYSGIVYDFSSNLKILLGFCIFSGAISTLATAKIVKIAAE